MTVQTKEQQRQAIRAQLIKELTEPEKPIVSHKSNNAICKRAKFIARNKRDREKDGDLKKPGAMTGPGAASRDGGDATKPGENGN